MKNMLIFLIILVSLVLAVTLYQKLNSDYKFNFSELKPNYAQIQPSVKPEVTTQPNLPGVNTTEIDQELNELEVELNALEDTAFDDFMTDL